MADENEELYDEDVETEDTSEDQDVKDDLTEETDDEAVEETDEESTDDDSDEEAEDDEKEEEDEDTSDEYKKKPGRAEKRIRQLGQKNKELEQQIKRMQAEYQQQENLKKQTNTQQQTDRQLEELTEIYNDGKITTSELIKRSNEIVNKERNQLLANLVIKTEVNKSLDKSNITDVFDRKHIEDLVRAGLITQADEYAAQVIKRNKRLKAQEIANKNGKKKVKQANRQHASGSYGSGTQSTIPGQHLSKLVNDPDVQDLAKLNGYSDVKQYVKHSYTKGRLKAYL